MEQQDASTTGIYGHAAEDWEQILDGALDRHDHEALSRALFELHGELHHENTVISRYRRGPRIDRLVEQARRILGSEPTVSEVFEEEADRERRLWSRYQERYRQAFIPAALHGYLSTSAVFVEPTGEGAQYPGFDKFVGQDLQGNRREAVTLFHPQDKSVEDPVPANFFACYDVRRGRFTVERAYRTDLPRGAGCTLIAEQIRALVSDESPLREFEWDNVQNQPTYDAFVEDEENPRLRGEADPESAPLVHIGRRILAQVGSSSVQTTPTLDRFGFLDLCQIVD